MQDHINTLTSQVQLPGDNQKDWEKFRNLNGSHYRAIVGALIMNAPLIVGKIFAEHKFIINRAFNNSSGKIVIGMPSAPGDFSGESIIIPNTGLKIGKKQVAFAASIRGGTLFTVGVYVNSKIHQVFRVDYHGGTKNVDEVVNGNHAHGRAYMLGGSNGLRDRILGQNPAPKFHYHIPNKELYQ